MQHPAHILIVDDSIAARDGMMKTLSALCPDARLSQAKNAEEAEQIYRDRRPDFGLVDVNMPGRDGLDLAKGLLERDGNVRLVLYTADVQKTVQDKASAMGIPVIAKPISTEQLIETLQLS